MSRFVCVLVTLAVTLPLQAQNFPFSLSVPFPEIERFDPAIPTPTEVLGHEIGTKHTFPHEVVRYFEAVAAASDRVTVDEHARSYEGRPLIHAIVTSPGNHTRLSELQAANAQLSEDPGSADLTDMPVVAYQGYSIHGNEASGTEAAVLYLYYLAAGQGDWIDQALDQTILIVDPLFNPDGRDRFTDWVNGNRGTVATVDPEDREHNEPWPYGRTNHYWFDLNRDWLPAQHPESQGRMNVFHAWRPQVLTDHHEMGGDATFFFMPGVPSRNNPNTPERTFELTAALADHHAAALDAIGTAYYTAEGFDDFYYGKGSTFPDINGAVGILFEQASSRALKASTSLGDMTYAFTVRNQFATSISTLKGLVEHRVELLENHRDFYAAVPEFTRRSPVKGYVVSLDRGGVRADMMLELMARHDIDAFELADDVVVDGRRFEAGAAYVLPIAQRQGRLLEAAFETMRTFGDSLFYDVSTWTLPLAYDLEYAELTADPAGLLGDPVQAGSVSGSITGTSARHAYLIPWDQQWAARAALRILEAGVTPTVATRPFSAMVGGEVLDFERGTLIVPVVPRAFASADEAGPDVHALVAEAVANERVQVYAADTGLTPAGPDLGGRSTQPLELPRVALVTGEGTSMYQAGEVWHLLSEHYQMPVSLRDADGIGDDLDHYTTLILAGGWYGDLNADAVRAWVRGGGRLILQDSAVNWARQNELLTLEAKEFDLPLDGVAYEDLGDTRGAQAIGGAIFELELDTTHPLAFGLPERLPVFRQGNTFYEAPELSSAGVGRYSDRGILSGYISDEKLADLPGSAGVVVQQQGRGHVTAFMDRVYFRAFWHGSSRLLTNAIFLGPAY
ncbi:MAG: hypothetical protein JJ896_07195 [Rhodothermales bacterium]|nr:hypothetical protein [Rhodothermales bacterium]MBO6779423.1 hypothetical protein [Rhodothermales bacterium]